MRAAGFATLIFTLVVLLHAISLRDVFELCFDTGLILTVCLICPCNYLLVSRVVASDADKRVCYVVWPGQVHTVDLVLSVSVGHISLSFGSFKIVMVSAPIIQSLPFCCIQ